MSEPAEQAWRRGPGLLDSVWRYRTLIVVATVLGAVAGYGLASQQPPRYEASARLLLANSQTVFAGSPRSIDPTTNVEKQAERIVSTPVFARATQILDGNVAVHEAGGRVEVTTEPEVDLIVITASDSDPARAAALADAVAEAYQQVVAEDVRASTDAAIAELETAREDLEDRIADLEERIAIGEEEGLAVTAQLDAAIQQLATLQSRAAELTVDASLYGSGVELFERAEVPDAPVAPRLRQTAALGAILGMLGASAFAWWRAEQAESVDTPEDAGRVLESPLLGVVPVLEKASTRSRVTHGSDPGFSAEPYEFVVSSLDFALAESDSRLLLVTSVAAADGKTLTARNLAVAAHHDGRRVVLVDADLRARGLTRFEGAEEDAGLSDLVTAADFDRMWHDMMARRDGALPFLSAGRRLDDAAAFVRTSDFRNTMLRIRQCVDLAFIDSPPLLAVSDASAVAGQADGIILVVNRGTRISQLHAARERLAFIGTPLLGYILNRASRASSPYSYGGYGHGVGNGQGERRGWVGRQWEAVARKGN